MAKRPSFQFYPADWLGNANLMRCTQEEKGGWIDTMCLMHDSPTEYGILRWSLKEIARAVHCKVTVLVSLVEKGVMKGADPGERCAALTYTPRSGRVSGPTVTLIPEQPGPLWYSSRMVRDEYIRQHRGEATRFQPKPVDGPSLNPSPNLSLNHPPMPPFGESKGDGSSSSSSSSSSKKDSCSEPAAPFPEQPQEPAVLTLPCVGEGPHTWPITSTMLKGWQEAFPGLDPLAEARKMALWLEATPAKRKTYRGMARFALNWLSNAQNRPQGRTAPPGSQRSTQPGQQLAADYLSTNRDFFGDSDEHER